MHVLPQHFHELKDRDGEPWDTDVVVAALSALLQAAVTAYVAAHSAVTSAVQRITHGRGAVTRQHFGSTYAHLYPPHLEPSFLE
jgi:hypothetical protein